jgi:RNA polymerase sigma-70 factor, ECF subfamily
VIKNGAWRLYYFLVEMNDTTLLPGVAEAARPDTARLEASVRTWFRFTWRMLRRLGVPASDADDAAQEVFMRFSHIITRVEVGTERVALYHTARGVAANHRRKAARREESDGIALSTNSGAGSDPETDMENRQARGMLDQVLQRIPLPLRTVYVLHEIEEISLPEIARIQGVPEGTAASRLRRARVTFQQVVQELRDSILEQGVDR